jgi:hypothetical protein
LTNSAASVALPADMVADKYSLLWDWGGKVMIGFNRFLVWDA